MELDWENSKHDVVKFLEQSIDHFLTVYDGEPFYALALDIETEYLEINIKTHSNSQFDFIIEHYYHQRCNEEERKEIKYNPGDWEHGWVDTKYLVESRTYEEFIRSCSDQQFLSLEHDFKEMVWKALKDYKLTSSYQRIPKTKDYISFVITHEEDVFDALARAQKEGTAEAN